MIPKPEPTEVNQLATQAIDFRKKESITLLEAIETVCCQALVPKTDKPLTIGNVKAYLHLLQDTVIGEVHAQLSHAAETVIRAEQRAERSL